MDLRTTDTIALDLKQTAYITVNAVQNDKDTRYVHIVVTNNGVFYQLQDVYVQARIATPDGLTFLEDTVLESDGTITYTMSPELLHASGKARIELNIYRINYETDTNARLTTLSFFVHIMPNVFDDDDIKYSSEYIALTNLINKAMADYEYVINATEENANTAQLAQIAAGKSEGNAKESENKAKESELKAKDYKEQAGQYKTETNDLRNETEEFKNESYGYLAINKDYALASQSYANGTAKNDDGSDYRENQSVDNAYYWYNQAKSISSSLAGTLKPMGTIKFEELPTIEMATTAPFLPVQIGWMYNISNDFKSDERFKDGGNIKYDTGNNVYCTADGFWDVLASKSNNIVVSETEPLDQNEGSLWFKPYE